jgi:starch synthase
LNPCGISQMLAMRAGQPCLVHGVGGLNDTVIDGVSGFVFRGANGDEQGVQLLKRFTEVLQLHQQNPKKFQAIARAAARARFTWETVAKEYLEKLY